MNWGMYLLRNFLSAWTEFPVSGQSPQRSCCHKKTEIQTLPAAIQLYFHCLGNIRLPTCSPATPQLSDNQVRTFSQRLRSESVIRQAISMSNPVISRSTQPCFHLIPWLYYLHWHLELVLPVPATHTVKQPGTQGSSCQGPQSHWPYVPAVCFLNWVSLYRSFWPRTYFIDQTVLLLLPPKC